MGSPKQTCCAWRPPPRSGQSMAECARFQRPYDLRVLAQAAAASFNVMHVCRQDALFDAFADYPVAAFSWALGPGNPSLAEAHRRTGRAVMGGIPAALATHTATDSLKVVPSSALTRIHRCRSCGGGLPTGWHRCSTASASAPHEPDRGIVG